MDNRFITPHECRLPVRCAQPGIVCETPCRVETLLCGRDTGGSLGCIEQAARVPLRVTLAENRVAGDQQLGSRFDDAADGIVSDATVNLNPITEAHLPSKFFEAADLIEGVGDELLAAKTGVDAHDEDVMDHAKDGDQQVDFGVGINDDGGLHLVLGYVFEGAVEVAAGFEVDADPVGPGIGESGDELVGILDHQVAIEGQFGVFAEGGDDGWADGDIGDEMAIHHVDVDDRTTAALGCSDFIAQTGKVSGKDGWDELDHSEEQGTGDRVQGTGCTPAGFRD
jgi:hypothetical protein